MSFAKISRLVLLLCTIGIGSCGSDDATMPSSIPTNGLQVFMSFGSGVNDESGGGNNGTLLGGATAAGALVTGGNDTDGMSLPATVLNGLGDFTVAAWLQINALRAGVHHVMSGANAVEDNAFIIAYRAVSDDWILGIDTHSNSNVIFATNAIIEDGTWHHVAVTRSGATARLYIDGAAVGSSVPVVTDALSIDDGGLIVGQDQDEVGGGFEADDSWAGSIDNLRIYNRALSAAEITLVSEETH